MKRGEVWWVSFEPGIGGEIRKKRPAVIVSNDAAKIPQSRSGCPADQQDGSSLSERGVYVRVSGEKGKAMADQLATVSKERLFKRIGVLSVEDMRKVEEAGKGVKSAFDLLSIAT